MKTKMKMKNKRFIPFPFFVDSHNERDYIFMVTDKEYKPMANSADKKEVRSIRDIVDNITYGDKISSDEKRYVIDNLESVYIYIDGKAKKILQEQSLKRLSGVLSLPIKDLRQEFETAITADKVDKTAIVADKVDETAIIADKVDETATIGDEDKARHDQRKKIEHEEQIEHYKKFKHIRLYDYMEIVEKVDTKKDRFYILQIGNKQVELTSTEVSQGQKLGSVLSRYIQSTTTKRANHLCEYLEAFDENISVPIKKGVNRTGWNDKDFFIPNRGHKNIKLMTNEDGLKKRYSQKGSLEQSKELIRAMSYKKAFFPFLGVLSSPLYGLIDDMKMFNHSTHLSASSGKGKTLSVLMALSLFGNPKEYKSNFSQTLVGAEMYLSENYDMPCFIDETESAKKVDDVIDTFYMYANKNGKARGTMSGNEVIARDIVSFRGHLITSGEKNLDTILEQSFSENLKNGAIRRVIDFEVGNDYFGDNYNHSEVMELKRKAFNNYGLFVDEWINILSRNKKKLNNDFMKISEKLDKNLADKELVYYAFVLVLKILFDNGYISKEAYVYQYTILVKMLDEEIEKRENVKSPELLFFEKFKEYIAMNKTMFGQGDFTTNKQLGEYSSDKKELYITKSGFGGILKEFNMSGAKKEIIKALTVSGKLKADQKRIMGSAYPLKLWAISLEEKQATHKEIIKDLKDSGNLIEENEMLIPQQIAKEAEGLF